MCVIHAAKSTIYPRNLTKITQPRNRKRTNTMKQYATIRLSDLEIVKKAKIRAAQDGVSLLEVVQRALREYLEN